MRSRTTIWAGLGLLAIVLTAFVAAAPVPAEDRARTIGSQLRCPVCQGESIADSPSETARNMMELVRLRVAEGATDQAIVDELLDAYGDSLLLNPPLRGATFWLWLAPVVALTVGIAMVARRFGGRAAAPGLSASEPVPVGMSRRWVWGAFALVLGGAIAVGSIGQFQQGRPEDQNPTGAGEEFDPEAVSNETLEAVIAANAENPAINGMRLALANRYFEEGDYQHAFGHYQIVLENEPAPNEAANAFTRLGWMVFDGNGETDLGLDLIDRGLELVPDDAFAVYLKGRILWCGKADADSASALFAAVLTSNDLDEEVRSRVESDLQSAQAGAPCE